MTHPSKAHPSVDVAVAAVVEKLSTIDALSPEHQKSADHAPLRLLITLRKTKGVLGGLWELPGGKIEPGESPEAAAVRELQEEVGIVVKPIAELPTVEHTYEHAHVRLRPFVCRRLHGMPDPIEVDDAKWVGLEELEHYAFPEASLPVLEALKAWVGLQERGTIQTPTK